MNEVIPLFAVIIFVWLGDTVNAFMCTENGIFANTDSNDCKTFVICNNDLSPTVYNCNDNTYFWPEGKGCFSQYNCATNSMRDNTNPCEGLSYNIVPDKYSADCTTYLTCNLYYYYSDGGNIQISQVSSEQCSSGTAFRPGYGCTNSYGCVNYQCTIEGLFENPNDCSTFIQCWKYYTYNNTVLTSFLYPELNNCPQNSKFNPYLRKCDEFYNCDGIDPHSGTDPCFDYNHANPFVPNPYDSDASSYILCQYNFPGFAGAEDVILQKECPAYTFFSPVLGKCYNNYDPSETCSKDPCSSGPGIYVNYKSDLCESYIECRDETKTREVYEPTYEIRYCPPGTRYSPETAETSKCSRQYVCPTSSVNYCYPQIPTTTTTTTTTAIPFIG